MWHIYEIEYYSAIKRRLLLLFSRTVMTDSLRPHDSRMTDFSVIHYLLELLTLMSTELMMPSNHLILCHPLLLMPSILPSIRVFSSESALHIRWPVEGAEYMSNKGMNGEQMDIHQLLKESCIHDQINLLTISSNILYSHIGLVTYIIEL